MTNNHLPIAKEIISNPLASQLILTARTRQCRVPTINRGRETALPCPLDHSGATGIDISQQQSFVSIYWDYENIPDVKQANNLLLFAASLGCVVTKKVYDKNWQQENNGSQKRQRIFVNLGFDCVNVPQNIKNAADFSLFGDCSGEAAVGLYPHTFIILSGDGYGEILIPKLQDKGKKVIIFARPGNENKNLESLADGFHFVDELPKLIEAYKRGA